MFKKSIPDKFLYGLIIVLLFPALLINLGLVAFIDDEGIRSLVALEMKLSGNYIVPTIHGETYLNKPPLYNWILLLFFELTGVINEWTARIPTVIFLLCYAYTIYFYTKKHFSKKIAFINALALITCGRILFYDSLLGLIDICFSWVIFSMFMWIYHQWEKRNYNKLFVGAYFLTALGFLMKGLPAIVFIGTALLAHFIYQKEWKKLFSKSQFLGIGIFFLIVGSYYIAFHQQQNLGDVFVRLFDESAKRTAIQHGWKDTFLHLFTFPFELVYHFLPWTIFVIYFFNKSLIQKIKEHPFLSYCLLIFFSTILVYWVSVEVYPRYLFMHLPLLFTCLIYAHFEHQKESTWQFKTINLLFGIVAFGTIGVLLAPFFVIELQEIDLWAAKVIFLALSFTLIASMYLKQKGNRLLCFIVILLVARIGFNWFILPIRERIEFSYIARETSIKMGSNHKGKKIYMYKDTYGMSFCNSFYLTNELQGIVPKKDEFSEDELFIIYPPNYPDLDFEKLDSLRIIYKERTYYLGREGRGN